MASFDTDACELDAFDFDAFLLDFHLDLGVDATSITPFPQTIQSTFEVTTSTPPVLTVTPYDAILGIIAFDNVSFDTLSAFDADAFAAGDTIGIVVTATKQTVNLTELNAAIEAPTLITATRDSLSVTTYPVVLTFGGILTTTNTFTLSNHQVSLVIDDEWIPAAKVLALDTQPASISTSLVGSNANLTVTTYPVGLAVEILVNVNFDALVIIAPQVTSIDYNGVTIIGTSSPVPLTVTEYPVSISPVLDISTIPKTLNVSIQPAIIEFSFNLQPSLIPLTLTTYPTIIGFNWQATMKVATLNIGIPRMTVGENNVDIWQPIPDDLDENVVNHF
jgi:hypothetical protein